VLVHRSKKENQAKAAIMVGTPSEERRKKEITPYY
jgi:hypothetical protein